MRYVASQPLANVALIRVAADGASYEIVADEPVRPTSELPAHLSVHDYLIGAGRLERAVVHTHPIELVAMTHNPEFLGKDVLTRLLWSMIPETRAFCPKGLGIVPYTLPGSQELADRTIALLDDYDVVMWTKHGALAIGTDLIEAFDPDRRAVEIGQDLRIGPLDGIRPHGNERRRDAGAQRGLRPLTKR